MQSNNLKSTVMEKEKLNNGLANAGIVGLSVINSDNPRCDECPCEEDGCVKLICYGGHVCLWG